MSRAPDLYATPTARKSTRVLVIHQLDGAGYASWTGAGRTAPANDQPQYFDERFLPQLRIGYQRLVE
ncbi:MAG: hypothetical protein AAFV32_08380 [Myxococcota bacterium]